MNDKTMVQFQALGGDLCSLWMEAAGVIGLRTLRIVQGGPKGAAEAKLMVSEKIAAQQRLIGALAAGKLGSNPLAVTRAATRFYLKGVRANRQRLMRG